MSITTADESDFLVSNFPQAVVSDGIRLPYWLGGLQPPGSPEPRGAWEWVTGEPFTFQNWAPGEPNDATSREQWLHFSHDVNGGGQWNDQPCGDRDVRGYVVEYEP